MEKQRGPFFFVMYKRCSKSFHNVEICFGDLLGAKGRQVGGLFSRSSTKLLFFSEFFFLKVEDVSQIFS